MQSASATSPRLFEYVPNVSSTTTNAVPGHAKCARHVLHMSSRSKRFVELHTRVIPRTAPRNSRSHEGVGAHRNSCRAGKRSGGILNDPSQLLKCSGSNSTPFAPPRSTLKTYTAAIHRGHTLRVHPPSGESVNRGRLTHLLVARHGGAWRGGARSQSGCVGHTQRQTWVDLPIKFPRGGFRGISSAARS